jgi:putative hydrolase of the HAD superfamily
VGEPSAVIFDLDDTLYAERRFALSGFAAVALDVAARTGRSPDELFRSLCRSYRDGQRATALQDLVNGHRLADDEIAQGIATIRAHQPRLRLPRLAREVLSTLRAQGHRLAILTNGLPSTQRGKVAALDLAPLVDVVVYAQEYAPAGKPHAACFEAVLSQLEVAASRSVFVGDHPEKDIAGARACGLRTIHVVTAAAPWPVEADAAVTSLRAVPRLVARLLEVRDAATA